MDGRTDASAAAIGRSSVSRQGEPLIRPETRGIRPEARAGRGQERFGAPRRGPRRRDNPVEGPAGGREDVFEPASREEAQVRRVEQTGRDGVETPGEQVADD